jgi:hypothetical protein
VKKSCVLIVLLSFVLSGCNVNPIVPVTFNGDTVWSVTTYKENFLNCSITESVDRANNQLAQAMGLPEIDIFVASSISVLDCQEVTLSLNDHARKETLPWGTIYIDNTWGQGLKISAVDDKHYDLLEIIISEEEIVKILQGSFVAIGTSACGWFNASETPSGEYLLKNIQEGMKEKGFRFEGGIIYR